MPTRAMAGCNALQAAIAMAGVFLCCTLTSVSCAPPCPGYGEAEVQRLLPPNVGYEDLETWKQLVALCGPRMKITYDYKKKRVVLRPSVPIPIQGSILLQWSTYLPSQIMTCSTFSLHGDLSDDCLEGKPCIAVLYPWIGEKIAYDESKVDPEFAKYYSLRPASNGKVGQLELLREYTPSDYPTGYYDDREPLILQIITPGGCALNVQASKASVCTDKVTCLPCQKDQGLVKRVIKGMGVCDVCRPSKQGCV